MSRADRYLGLARRASRIGLLSVSACLSLAIAIAISALWVRSHWVCDSVESQSLVPVGSGRYRFSDTAIALGTDYAVVTRQVEEGTGMQPYDPLPAGWVWSRDPPPPPVARHTWRSRWFGWVMGFSFSYGHSAPHPPDGEYFYNFQAVIPDWSLVLAAGLLPAWWAVRRLRRCRRPVSAQVCIRCGYDLRGTPERCPECGALVPITEKSRPCDTL